MLRKKIALLATVAAVIGCTPLLAGRADAQSQPQRINGLIDILASGGNALSAEDWTFIDFEHSPYILSNLETRLADLAKTRNAKGQLTSTPLVRIPVEGHEDPGVAVKQVLDSGAYGIVFPHIESKAEAERAVKSMRYPPQEGAKYPTPRGVRGFGPGRAAKFWGITTKEYLERADVWPLNPNGELFAMLMIESEEGVKHADEIMSVPGVAAVFIGPSDLGLSYGVGLGGPDQPAPKAEAAVATVAKACKAHKVVCAYSYVYGKGEYQKRLDQGFRMHLGGGK